MTDSVVSAPPSAPAPVQAHAASTTERRSRSASPARRRTVGVAAVLALGLVPLSTPVLDAALPDHALLPTAAAAPATLEDASTVGDGEPHLIALRGTENTRTFSGYTTADGKTIAPNVIRSDNLSGLTAADQRALADLDVTSVIDLRTVFERGFSPNKPVPGAVERHVDVLGGGQLTNVVILPEAYRAFVTEPSARKAFGTALTEIKEVTGRGEAVLYQCSAGKDRTGWTSAVLLTILGVDRATIERDFMASNTFRNANPQDPLNGVNLSWLRSSFATVDSEYGDFDAYVRDGLGLSDDDVEELRANILVEQ